MSEPGEERIPKTQLGFSGRQHRPPRSTAHNLEDSPGDARCTVYLLDPMLVRDLASVLHVKPFRVIADLLELKQFKLPDDTVDFETASTIARRHGYRPARPPPGMLVL